MQNQEENGLLNNLNLRQMRKLQENLHTKKPWNDKIELKLEDLRQKDFNSKQEKRKEHWEELEKLEEELMQLIE